MDNTIREKFRNLPVAEVAEDLIDSLRREPRLVVTAPPGAGKSTFIPLLLLENGIEGKILMLEPRRLAARQVAERMASMLGEKVRETVGYRVRFDTCVSSSTRIEVITEGILERMLIEDPTLDGIGTVIFDEFHERSLSSDLTLALTRQIQQLIRPDLRILIMSATIDAASICEKLDATHINSPGRLFDVQIKYGEDFEPSECAEKVAGTIRKALRESEGDILVFLPGQGEITRCREILEDNGDGGAEILSLYGLMPPEEQRRTLRPDTSGKRRIVLATPIAETSLTIEGISVVIDSGLYRTPVIDPLTGLSKLTTARISKDMAVQRAGRAGRLVDGVCYRMWSKATDHRMQETRQPEILSADLSSMVLAIAAWGEKNPLRLPWITPPAAGHVAEGAKLLRAIGAIDSNGGITGKGKRISALPCHPRIAAMLTEAGHDKAVAADIAALLEEKDPMNDETDADLSLRVSMLCQFRKGKLPSAWRRIDNIAGQYRRILNVKPYHNFPDPEKIGQLLSLAYPERIAMRVEDGRYRLATGTQSVLLHPDDDLARFPFLTIASMGKRIYLAAPIGKEYVSGMASWQSRVMWDSREGAVVAREELRLGSLTLATRPLKDLQPDEIARAVATAAVKEGLTMFDFNEDVKTLQLRIEVVSSWHPGLQLPDVSTDVLLSSAHEWLPMYIGKASTVQELRKLDMRDVIMGRLSYDQQQALDRMAPVSYTLPSRRTVRIRYRRGADAPIVSARLQDCFGLMNTPTVDEGRRKVLMELLSPGFKPVQLTQDMEGFWRGTYFEVRKELKRRYPKHRWPDDPLNL